MGRKRAKLAPSVSEQLRQAISDSGMSLFRLARESGVDYAMVHRFFHGDRAITSRTVDRLCRYLGLELRPSKQKGA